jgi:hypothetical protein
MNRLSQCPTENVTQRRIALTISASSSVIDRRTTVRVFGTFAPSTHSGTSNASGSASNLKPET